MVRQTSFAFALSATFLLTGLAVSEVQGQNRVADLFKTKNHDFGVVARGAKRDYSFKFVNTLNQPIQISGASRSCGCVTPIIKTKVVNPGEEGEIVAQFNTLSFVGDRRATINLSVSKPYFTQVQLHIRGYVRTDIVVNPNQADFNNVVAGEETVKKLKLAYAGSPNWKIKELVPSHPQIKAEVVETRRAAGRIDYELIVTMAPDMPWGFMNEQIVIVTNDKRKREVPISVTGNIKAPIELPSVVNIGNVRKGTTITKTLMVKSANAFTVTGVETENPRIQLSTPDSKNKLHMLKIEVDTTEAGTLNDTVTIKTDNPVMPSAQVRLTGAVIDK